MIDAAGRSCIYVPIMQNGKVVDIQGYVIIVQGRTGSTSEIGAIRIIHRVEENVSKTLRGHLRRRGAIACP